MQTGYQTKGQAFSSLLKLTAENNEGEENSKVGLIEKRESRRVNRWKNWKSDKKTEGEMG